MKSSILFLVLLGPLVFFALDRLSHKSKTGFQVQKILSAHPDQQEWSCPLSEDLAPIFSQPFTYLAKGTQSFVFVSQDGNYVLKFIKQTKNSSDQQLAFQSFCTAFHQLKEETGTLYIHLSQDPMPIVTLFDKKGRPHVVDLSKTMFALQKRADLLYPHLAALMKEGKVEDAKRAISSVFDLLRTFHQQKVAEYDPVLRRNCGFIGNRAVQMDIGTLVIDPSHATNRIAEHTASFKRWIDQNFPELSAHVEEERIHSSIF